MDLQLAINTATPGATIQIPDNERCVGSFTVNKPLTITGGVGSAVVAGSGNEFPAFNIPPATGPVVLRKLIITAADDVLAINDFVRYGGNTVLSGQASLDMAPQGLWLDECDIFGRPNLSSQRGVFANGANFKATKTRIREIHWKGFDTQAICSTNGPGPFTIEDCYLEAAGENVMFGGDRAVIPNLTPSDIVIRRCVFFKPQSWRGVWSVKNLFELKNARRVLVDGCVFDGCWTDAQTGRALQFTPRPSDSGLWAVVEDVQFINNTIRNTGAGANILGADESNAGTVPTDTRLRRLRIANCVFEIDGGKFGSDGHFLIVTNKTEDVVIENNTVFHTGNVIASDYAPNTRFIYRNNISRHNTYGVFGSGMSTGNPTLQQYFPGTVFSGNVMAKEGGAPGNVESLYPAGNFFPATMGDVGFVDLAARDYHLKDSSPYKGAGADIEVIKAAQGGAVTIPPQPLPPPTSPAPPTSAPSPDGTKSPPAPSIIDSQSATWTFGPNKETLRNGTQADGGQGTVYKYVNSTVYVLGMDSNWWKWAGGWSSVGPTEPGTVVQPPPTEPPPQPPPLPPITLPRVLLYPTSLANQVTLWQTQAKDGYRPNRTAPRPANQPKGTYVEFVKW